jgi:hypothetical protein
MDVSLTIIICTHNRSGLLAKLLDSLLQQTIASDCYDILVVDNRSTDDTVEVVESYKNRFNSIRYVYEPEIGLNHARNTGVENAKTSWLGFLDDDGWVDKDWCQAVFRIIEEASDKLVALGGPIVPDFEVPPPRWFSPDLETFFDDRKRGWLDPEKQTLNFGGGNMVMRRDALLEAGGFDPSIGMKGHTLGLAGETLVHMAIAEKHPYFWHEPGLVLHHRIPEQKLSLTYQVKRSLTAGSSLSAQNEGRHNVLLRTGVLGKAVLSILWSGMTTNYFSDESLQRGTYAVIKKFGKITRWL